MKDKTYTHSSLAYSFILQRTILNHISSWSSLDADCITKQKGIWSRLSIHPSDGSLFQVEWITASQHPTHLCTGRESQVVMVYEQEAHGLPSGCFLWRTDHKAFVESPQTASTHTNFWPTYNTVFKDTQLARQNSNRNLNWSKWTHWPGTGEERHCLPPQLLPCAGSGKIPGRMLFLCSLSHCPRPHQRPWQDSKKHFHLSCLFNPKRLSSQYAQEVADCRYLKLWILYKIIISLS